MAAAVAKGVSWGIVHHSAGTLGMPYRKALNQPIEANSVVDENRLVKGTERLFACDMSVMPFSSAANPVRTLVALALRLIESPLEMYWDSSFNGRLSISKQKLD